MFFYFVIKNFILGYLVDINALICYASTGVRGMKYKNNAVVGMLVPNSVSTKFVSNISLSKRSATGAGLFLNEFGSELLIDQASQRKS